MTEPLRIALSPSLAQNPSLDDWIRIDAQDDTGGAGTITVRTGKVELGQGILTAVAMIAAEELDVALERIRIESADSARAPNEFMTVGSMSVETSGRAVRQAAAEARAYLLERAAAELGAPVESLEVEDGVVCAAGGHHRVSYWQLFGGRRFERNVTGQAALKDPASHRVVGKRAGRIDLADKVFGARRFVHDLALPGMVHARVVRPPSPDARLEALDTAAVEAMQGVLCVVRDGSFLAVAAEREEQAIAAAQALEQAARFSETPTLAPLGNLAQHLKERASGSYPLVDGTPTEQPVPPLVEPQSARHTVRATYTRPHVMHASIGPSAALARFDGDELTVWCSSQGVSVLAMSLAQVLRMPPIKVRAIHAEGAGCYGHNGSDDAALDAALVARALPGRPVMLKWTRRDEHAFEPYGPAMRIDVQASVDDDGRVCAYNHDVYSMTHIGRAMPRGSSSALIAAQQFAQPFRRPTPRPMLAPQAGIHRNADPLYRFAGVRVVKHLCSESPLRTSSLRSLGAFTNVFAMESMVDELAHAAGIDPLEFRLRHLDDERARAVIEAGAERAAFRQPLSRGDERHPRGRGMAFSQYENHKCYAAVFVEVEVDLATFAIRLMRAVIAADSGQVIDPDGLENQLEGGFVQAASIALKEQVTFDDTRITSLDWEGYPILAFDEVPPIETVLIDRRDRTPRGAGEATTGPTPAAIANAVFDACGARLRETPLSPARLRAALYG